MSRFPLSPDWIVLSWFALAAVSGAIGGCSAAALASTRSKEKTLKVLQAIAYTVIGTGAGLAVLLFGPLFGDSYSTEHLIREAFVAGVTVPILVAAQNLFSKIVLRYLGLEVQITLRRDHEERRLEDEEPEQKK